MSKYRARFEKLGDLKYISHLDTVRLFERTFRRAGIELKYTQGFNKHAIMSFASPMFVGLTGVDEYIDIEVEGQIAIAELLSKVNACLPEGVRMTKAVILDEKEKAIMGQITAADYDIIVETVKAIDFEKAINTFLKLESIVITKKGKKGEHEVDIKPMIYSVKSYEMGNNKYKLNVVAASGSNMNLSMEVFMDALIKYQYLEEYIYDYNVHRNKLFIGEHDNLRRPIED